MAGAIAASRASLPAAGLALAMPQCWQPMAVPSATVLAASEPAAPIRVSLDRERFSVFTALAGIEKRPVEEIIEESLATHAAHLLRTRHALHFDPLDEEVLATYLDDLAERREAWEQMEAESAERAATTPAMRQAAAAADERERFTPPDLEEWERALPYGAVEVLLAVEG